MLAPVGSLESFEPGGGITVAKGAGAGNVAMLISSVTTLEARGHRQGRRRPEDLPALCARRRQLGGRARQAGDGCGLRRLLHHRRHPGLFAPRARHRQALREVVAHRGDRPGPPGRFLVGQLQEGEGQVPRREVHAEGHRHRRGRRHRLPARRLGGLLLQPWRPPARPWPRLGGGAARGDRRGEGPRQDRGRRLVQPRQRYRQGDLPGRRLGRAWAGSTATASPRPVRPASSAWSSFWKRR